MYQGYNLFLQRIDHWQTIRVAEQTLFRRLQLRNTAINEKIWLIWYLLPGIVERHAGKDGLHILDGECQLQALHQDPMALREEGW